MSLPAASFEPVISYLNLASPGAEIRSGKTGNSASLRRSGHTTTLLNLFFLKQKQCPLEWNGGTDIFRCRIQ